MTRASRNFNSRRASRSRRRTLSRCVREMRWLCIGERNPSRRNELAARAMSIQMNGEGRLFRRTGIKFPSAASGDARNGECLFIVGRSFTAHEKREKTEIFGEAGVARARLPYESRGDERKRTTSCPGDLNVNYFVISRGFRSLMKNDPLRIRRYGINYRTGINGVHGKNNVSSSAACTKNVINERT